MEGNCFKLIEDVGHNGNIGTICGGCKVFQLSLHYINHAGEEFRHLVTGFHDAESCDAIRRVLVNAFVMIHDARIIEAICIAPKATT